MNVKDQRSEHRAQIPSQRKTTRYLRRTLFVILTLLLFVFLVAIYLIRRPFPRIDGEIQLQGLKAPVEVYRDRFGVPHIYASNHRDLFFAQGYIHAQDRFWQMDFWRHVGSGRLSELFGAARVDSDKFLRTMGWARVVQKELQLLDPVSLSILESYTAGVNAYLSDRSTRSLSLEHLLVSLINSNYRVESWTPLHSLTWGKVMAWDLSMNMDDEIYRAALLKTLSAQQVEDLFPPYPEMNPLILPQDRTYLASAVGRDPITLPLLRMIAQRFAKLQPFTGERAGGLGSNNWVISGNLTTTGKPFLANDPHLSAQMPSIWYQLHLQCVPRSTDCPYDVAGFSFAGVPGVVIGHNDRVAWGFTNVGPDVMDLYIEKVNPQNPNQYEVNGEWKGMQVVREIIKTAGGADVPISVRYTRHGPVLSDTSDDLKGLTKTVVAGATTMQGSTETVPRDYAISLRWTALEPTILFPAIWKMNLARNWSDFRAAAASFDVPSQNCIYADIDGNIGYQMPGKIPVRANGNGRYPVPGWNDDYEWTGYIRFEELPNTLNPARGYIATANNPVVSNSYPYFLSDDWDYGYRARRIVEMIQKRTAPITLDYIKLMQGDNKNYNAIHLVPILLKISFNEARLEQARDMLKHWDLQQPADSAEAALFETFWKHVMIEAFHDDLPATYKPGGGNRWAEIVRSLISNPESVWWDRKNTSAKETRDQIIAEAFKKAVDELERSFGKDPADWKWGDLHTLTLENGSLGKSGIAVIEKLLNRGPYRCGGTGIAVNSTSWNAARSFEVTAIPSMRMIVDLSDLGNSVAIHSTGQSGHPFNKHYADMAEPWTKLDYHPMLWQRSDVEANAEGHLRLKPRQ